MFQQVLNQSLAMNPPGEDDYEPFALGPTSVNNRQTQAAQAAEQAYLNVMRQLDPNYQLQLV